MYGINIDKNTFRLKLLICCIEYETISSKYFDFHIKITRYHTDNLLQIADIIIG